MTYRAPSGDTNDRVAVPPFRGGAVDVVYEDGAEVSLCTRNQPGPTWSHGTCARVPTCPGWTPTGDAAAGQLPVGVSEEGGALADGSVAVVVDPLVADSLVEAAVVGAGAVEAAEVGLAAVGPGAALGAWLPQAAARTAITRTAIIGRARTSTSPATFAGIHQGRPMLGLPTL